MPLTFKLYKNFSVFSFQMQYTTTAREDDKCHEESPKYVVKSLPGTLAEDIYFCNL